MKFLASSPKTTLAALPRNIHAIVKEINRYFDNPQHRFDVDFQLEGTVFQKAVWKALQQIPCGTAVSYQQLANTLKTGPRAVGNACRANPLPLIIPCHRVIAKQGLGGFAGKTGGKLLGIKEWLLTHEGFL